MLSCPEHKKRDAELERGVLYCSILGDGCTKCRGVGHVDCEECSNERAQEWIARKRDLLPGIAARNREYPEAMQRTLRLAESEHFVVIFEVDSLKVGRQRLDGHELLHLYVERMEQVFADYLSTLRVEPSEFQGKFVVMVWTFPKDHEDACARWCGQTSRGGVKLLGAKARYSVLARNELQLDEPLHRNLVHSVAHLVLSAQAPPQWIGQLKGGWADEGLAHWFEERAFGLCDNFCYQEVATTQGFKGGKWRPEVRKMAAAGTLPSLGALFEQNTDTLTLEQHAASFSLVDYLLSAQDPKLANQLFKRLRAKTPARDALKEIYGLNPVQLEERWRAWVIDTYPAR
jgi:hypothetical protein